ncbi:MAG: YIP1 family protein [Cyanobacteria bacterium P01_H01_bin.74]
MTNSIKSKLLLQEVGQFVDVCYGVLFNPVDTFQKQTEEYNKANSVNEFNKPMGLLSATLIVAFISLMAPLTNDALTQEANYAWLPLTLPVSAIMGIVSWVTMAAIIAALAFIFQRSSNIKSLLVCTALATLPWLFLGPLSLLKFSIFPAGQILFTFGLLGVWLWSVCLFCLAVTKAYQLPLLNGILLLFMPFAFTGIFFAWFSGFIQNMIYLF